MSCAIAQSQACGVRQQSSPRADIRCSRHSMADNAGPDNVEWLIELVGRSPLLPDQALRDYWRRVIPWLGTGARYSLAAVLLDVEHACME